MNILAHQELGSELTRAPLRYMLQSAARILLPDERVARCHRVSRGGFVDVLYSPVSQASHFGNLETCASVWHCAVCAAKITERRRGELQNGLTAYDGRVALVTYTVQHHRSQSLVLLLDGFLGALSALRNGKPWQLIRDRHCVVGAVRAVEITHGQNGWHPHAHVLYFLGHNTNLEDFGSDLSRRWLTLLAARGLSASAQVGVDIRAGDAAIGSYVTKFGSQWTVAHEVAKAHVKRARGENLSVAALLANYAAGDIQAGNLWREYALAFKGKKHLVWSRGLRSQLLGTVELTDDELAAQTDEMAVILARLSLNQWRVILANDARAELLEIARSGDPDRVINLLVSLGVV